ncbi:hypothetical protein [Gulosibacter bifidus]|uniref:Septum formation-related domain-containing protein n=1 Tax=Gulosibacter bifidus TaxID=272239 RepID=A0ABW5RL06_9MICO|nr:hypothetical protein [Gulosibacter bifidus]
MSESQQVPKGADATGTADSAGSAPEQGRSRRRDAAGSMRWWLVASALLIAGVVVGLIWAPFGRNQLGATPSPSPTPPQDVFALPAGSCIRELPSAWEFEFSLVDCADAHEGLVLGAVAVDSAVPAALMPEPLVPAPTVPVATGSVASEPATKSATPVATDTSPVWPGDDLLSQYAMLACEQSERWQDAVDNGYEVLVRWPLAADWDAGARDFLCLAKLPTASATPGVSPSPTA